MKLHCTSCITMVKATFRVFILIHGSRSYPTFIPIIYLVIYSCTPKFTTHFKEFNN